jgi:hypothetical protein
MLQFDTHVRFSNQKAHRRRYRRVSTFGMVGAQSHSLAFTQRASSLPHTTWAVFGGTSTLKPDWACEEKVLLGTLQHIQWVTYVTMKKVGRCLHCSGHPLHDPHR